MTDKEYVRKNATHIVKKYYPLVNGIVALTNTAFGESGEEGILLMLREEDSRNRIPENLGGFAVHKKVVGDIRPLKKD